MHSKGRPTWKGIVLRRKEKIKELFLTVEVSKAYSMGKDFEQYQKEHVKKTDVGTLLGASLNQLRRGTKSIYPTNVFEKQSRRKRPKSKVI